MLEKLRVESQQLSTNPPKDPKLHAYAALNCAATAWNLKDWAWAGIAKDARRRLILDELAGDTIESLHEFENLICTKNCIAICHQLITSAKHVSVNGEPHVGTSIQFLDSPLTKQNEDEPVVTDEDDTPTNSEVFMDAYYFWKRLLSELQLTDSIHS